MPKPDMKPTLNHLLSLTAILSTSIAAAQEAPPPPGTNPPPRDAHGDRPGPGPGDPGRPGDDRRPDGPRPPRPEDFGPGENPAFPGARRDRQGPMERFKSAVAAVPAKPQPYLGVATSPLDAALTAQLGFTPGMGLIVDEVIPDGPAAKAGVQALDVIKQVNDQLVSNSAQLTALARHFGKDAEVSLVILRKGQEQKLAVKIGEHLMRDPGNARADGFGGMPFGKMMERRDDNPRPDDNERDERRPRDPRAEPTGPPQKPSRDLLREIGPGGAPQVREFRDRISTTWNTASAKVSLKNSDGEIEVRSDDGRRTMTAKNAQGVTVFEGPIDTAEQRKAIPPEFQKMLDQVEARSRTSRRGGGAFERENTPPEPPDRP